MEKIKQIIIAFQVIIPIAALVRILSNMQASMVDERECEGNRKRNRNIIIFVCIAESVMIIVDTFFAYFR